MKFFIVLVITYLALVTTGIFQAQAQQSSEQKYHPISYPALANMVWRYQTYQTDNDEVLDDYLRITNCDLYNKYYMNDFLWGNIRESARRKLDYYAHELPNRFEIKTAIPLGRYDFKRSAFLIDDAYQMDNAGAIEIPITDAQVSCGIIESVPSSMKFSAENKFALFEIPVPAAEAEKLLDKIKRYQYEGVNENKNRVLAARFRISINGVRMTWNNDRDKRTGIIFQGQLDEIAFFADPEMTDLVWRKPFVELEDNL